MAGSWPLTDRVGFGLSVLGAAISAYLTFEHYTQSASLVCAENGVVNCLNVTTSAWSLLFGIPVALLGLGFFVLMTALYLPAVATRLPAAPLGWARLGLAVAGVVMALYLVWAEFFMIGQICLWCTGAHLLAAALLLLEVYRRAAQA